jgi:cytochrome c biogenesis protein CcmG, thiol:disulfide interchange protein DsbE
MNYSHKDFIKYSSYLLIFSIGWIIMTAFIFLGPESSKETAPAVGFLAPEFKLSDLNGEEIAFNGNSGKPVILNLWASWCLPCKAEMPALQKVYGEYKSSGLIVYGVNATNQDDLAAVETFINDNNISFPILLDKEGAVSKIYALRALPTTFFIRPDGRIQQVMIGGPFTEAFLRSQVEDMLALEK